jgi:hypothetical protein
VAVFSVGQVNYAILGDSCYNGDDFLTGFSTVYQSSNTSYNNWHAGSKIAHVFTSKTNLRPLKRDRMLSMSVITIALNLLD